MAGNNVIQILRGTRDEIASNKNKDVMLNEGQLLYNLTDNYLTCGGENGSKLTSLPVTTRSMSGHYDDQIMGILPSNCLDGSVDKYRVGPVVTPTRVEYDENGDPIKTYYDSKFEIDSALGSKIILGSDFIKLSLSDGKHVTLNSSGFSSSSGSSASSVNATDLSASSANIGGALTSRSISVGGTKTYLSANGNAVTLRNAKKILLDGENGTIEQKASSITQEAIVLDSKVAVINFNSQVEIGTTAARLNLKFAKPTNIDGNINFTGKVTSSYTPRDENDVVRLKDLGVNIDQLQDSIDGIVIPDKSSSSAVSDSVVVTESDLDDQYSVIISTAGEKSALSATPKNLVSINPKNGRMTAGRYTVSTADQQVERDNAHGINLNNSDAINAHAIHFNNTGNYGLTFSSKNDRFYVDRGTAFIQTKNDKNETITKTLLTQEGGDITTLNIQNDFTVGGKLTVNGSFQPNKLVIAGANQHVRDGAKSYGFYANNSDIDGVYNIRFETHADNPDQGILFQNRDFDNQYYRLAAETSNTGPKLYLSTVKYDESGKKVIGVGTNDSHVKYEVITSKGGQTIGDGTTTNNLQMFTVNGHQTVTKTLTANKASLTDLSVSGGAVSIKNKSNKTGEIVLTDGSVTAKTITATDTIKSNKNIIASGDITGNVLQTSGSHNVVIDGNTGNISGAYLDGTANYAKHLAPGAVKLGLLPEGTYTGNDPNTLYILVCKSSDGKSNCTFKSKYAYDYCYIRISSDDDHNKEDAGSMSAGTELKIHNDTNDDWIHTWLYVYTKN